MPRATDHPRTTLTPAEKLTRTDDLMSDVLDACLWPDTTGLPDPSHQRQNKRTIKFTPEYRRPRSLNIDDIKDIISRVQSNDIKNISEATSLIRQIPAVMSYIGKGEPPRVGKHIGLYLQLFLPKCGIKFCETDRYDQRRRALDPSRNPSAISSTRASSCAASESVLSGMEMGNISESNNLHDSTSNSITGTPSKKQCRRQSRQSTSDPSASSSSSKQRIHLAVFASRDYLVNDIIVGCEGSFADLTEEEDLRLRGLHPLDGHPDFSHLVNSRGKFQVFCGPARFVNHDCRNNVVLLREGFTIKFKVVQPIRADEEIVTSYGANYFGEGNCECMCATCEQTGRGFYAEDLTVSSQQLSPLCPPVKGVTCDESELSSVDAIDDVKEVLSSPLSVKEESDRIHSPISTEHEPSLRLLEESSSLQNEITQPESAIRRGRGRPPSKRTALHRALSKPAPTPEASQSKKPPTSPSRSSSLRRHQSRASLVKASLASAVDRLGFVSNVRFTPTTDLTLPVLNIPGTSQLAEPYHESDWNYDQTADSTSTSMSILTTAEQEEYENLHNNHDELRQPTQVANATSKRKTYWITSKQRQLGLLPWDSERSQKSEHRVSLGHDNPRRYSSITPSLLGPSGSQRRQTTSFLPDHQLSQSEPPSGELRGTKKRTFSNSTTSPDAHLPKRSYWISTKEKQLGIVPWEPPPPDLKAKISESQPRRSTRSAQKAIQGVQPFKGLPSAPRGSRLSFRVIESGTQEAELLGSAIGRELLGFRPTNSKKKTKEESTDTTSKPNENQESGSHTRDQDEVKTQGNSGNTVSCSAKRKKTIVSAVPSRRRRKSTLEELRLSCDEDYEAEQGEEKEMRTRDDQSGDLIDESEGEQTNEEEEEGINEYDLAGKISGSVIAIGSWSNPDSYRIQSSCKTNSNKSTSAEVMKKSSNSKSLNSSIKDITSKSSNTNNESVELEINEFLDLEKNRNGKPVEGKEERKLEEIRKDELGEEEEEIDMLETSVVGEDQHEYEKKSISKVGIEDGNETLLHSCYHHHHYHHPKSHQNLTSELSELDDC